jgi:hypothetical protein
MRTLGTLLFATALTSVATAQSLTTNLPTTGLSNVFAGVYLDLTASGAGPGLLVNQIDTYVWTTGTHELEIWTKPGSYVGFDTNQAAWTMHSQYTITATGSNTTPFSVVLSSPILLPAGQTVGVYVMTQTGGIRYTGGTNPQTTFSNADLTLFSNLARSGGRFGGSAFTPRAFAGTIHYEPVPEPATMAALALGSACLLRRRKKIQS